MKHFLAVAGLLLSLTAIAQKGNLELGGGLKFDISHGYYEADPDFFGINLRAYYYIHDRIRLAPNVNINLPYEEQFSQGTLQIRMFTFNGEGHFLFPLSSAKNLTLYGIGGFSYNRASATAKAYGQSVTEKASDTSLSLGGGLDYQLNKGKLFAELKDLFGDYSPWFLGFGYILSL